MNQPNQAHQEPLAPIRHLVKSVIHKDRDLAANVRRLRWRRTRPQAQQEPAQQAPEVQP